MKITVTYRINPSFTKEKYVIAVFDSADDLLCCADFLKENQIFTENINLYKYNKKYIILFPYSFPTKNKMFYIKEFGRIKFVCKNTVSHIKEYGYLICDDLMPLLK